MDSDRFSNENARIGEFRRRIARHVQCRACGYEPPKEGTPARCPKCRGGCWETFVRVGKLRPAGAAAHAAAGASSESESTVAPADVAPKAPAPTRAETAAAPLSAAPAR